MNAYIPLYLHTSKPFWTCSQCGELFSNKDKAELCCSDTQESEQIKAVLKSSKESREELNGLINSYLERIWNLEKQLETEQKTHLRWMIVTTVLSCLVGAATALETLYLLGAFE